MKRPNEKIELGLSKTTQNMRGFGCMIRRWKYREHSPAHQMLDGLLWSKEGCEAHGCVLSH